MSGHKQILIVDDDPKVLLILRTTLERMSGEYGVVTARDGMEALAKVEDDPFDLVITDVRMPGIDGIELVEAIRALSVDIALIWITAYGCHNLQAKGDQLNVYRCLEKPLRIGEIRRVVLGALEVDPLDN